MTTTTAPCGVHLVGSVPLDDSEQVFRAVCGRLGRHLRRLPDGETGDRQQWVQFQLGVLSARPEFELVTNDAPGWEELPPSLRLRDGVSAEDVDFANLGYADVALRSYTIFERLQAEGVIPPSVRFQVSLPTPLANATAWMQFDPQFPVLFERYTVAMMTELDRLIELVPRERLAIQWDVCFEVLMYEGWMPMPQGVDRQVISDHLVRISEAVPAGVEVGYHFCFGDFGHQHLREPEDTGRIVELVGAFAPRVRRPIAWLHIPVPIERDDAAYFDPLRNLTVPDGAEVYLGLVHFRDGVDGARRRIARAQDHLGKFGVATECGMGRRPPERGGTQHSLEELLALHAEVAEPVVG
jgi:hypothetical protein